jgi:hypothetical protein
MINKNKKLARRFLSLLLTGSCLATACFFFGNCSFFGSFDPPDFSLDSLSFSHTALILEQGTMDILPLIIHPADVQAQTEVSWEFDDQVIAARTDNFGAVITALQAGETIVRARAAGKTATCVVTVLPSSGERVIPFPYVYSATEFLAVKPGETARIAASLFGGTGNDMNGYSFTIDKPAAASLSPEGNYCWITGREEGLARVTVRHTKAAYGYTFLVSCDAGGTAIPFITTAENIITINRSLDTEIALTVDLRNPPAAAATALFSYALVDEEGQALSLPPVSLFAAGKQALITPIRAGECFIRVSHPAAPYPLDILIRVIEQIDRVYLEPSQTLIRLSGPASQSLSVSLVNLPPGIEAGAHEFVWSFPPEAEELLEWHIYGDGPDGRGNTVWLTGKQSGSLLISISHPLAAEKRDVLVVIRDLASSAAQASTYISTSQNYVRTRVGDPDTAIALYINNTTPGEESLLSWHIEHEAADGSGAPVIAWISGTGTASSSARNARSVASGHALIAPLREGTAHVTISHPRAVYPTKILVTVLPPAAAIDAPFSLATGTPFITLQNGASASLTVNLSGPGKIDADETAIAFASSSGNLTITANGRAASLQALGFGTTRETVTVSHPHAAYPLTITALRYDSETDRDTTKIIYAQEPYHSLAIGQTAYLAVQTVNLSPTDTLSWTVTAGEDRIALNQLDKSNATVTALAPGPAAVSVALAGTAEELTFSIAVKPEGVINENAPRYLTTGHNVVTLNAGESAEISVTPVNISERGYADLLWSTADGNLIELIPNGAAATVRARAASGRAALTVSHPLAANTLELFVHLGNQYEYKNADVAYITTPADTLTLRAGATDTLFQAALAHTESPQLDTTGFSFTIADSTIASISWSSVSNTCFISPRTPGRTILTVTHPNAAYPKEILVLVDRPEGDQGSVPYITTTANVITVASGAYTAAAVSLAGAAAETGTWQWTASDTRIAQVITNSGPTAMIRGESPGTALITVSHSSSPHPLRLILICLDAALIQLKPRIQTDRSIVTLAAASSTTLHADMIGGGGAEETAFFSWSVSDPAVALLSGAGASAHLRGMKAGTAVVTVRSTRYPDSYSKTILVIVEDTAEEGCSITVNQQIVKLRPEASEGATVKAALKGGTALDPEQFIWWADDYHVIALSSLTDTARIEPTGVSGMTTVHVKHPKAPQTVDIVVIVSAFDTFAFNHGSKTITRGTIAFIPLRVPVTAEQTRVEYSSANTNVCAITGSAAVAMLAGVGEGATTVTAALVSASGVIATTDLAVMVTTAAQDPLSITTDSTVINMELGKSLTLDAALAGRGLSPVDDYDITWSSSDPHIASLLATEHQSTKGTSAYLTAKNPGEAVITLSHPKAATDLHLWIRIPPQNEASLTLDQTYVECFKDEGAVVITATLVNASPADYNTIIWTAPKAGGQVIVSISKAQGKTCNIVPRNVGRTTLRAQLPNGAYADCIISVNSAAEIRLETQAVHVNPGYTETVRYSTNPESVPVSWIAQSTTAADPETYFTFVVNEAAKTIAITGIAQGGGSLNGYFVSSSGGSTTRLQVYVEYTYQFALETSGVITREPRHGTTIAIPFTVYPPDLEVTAAVSDSRKLEVQSLSRNSSSGKGEVIVSALGEKNGLFVTLTAQNPRDPLSPPLIRTQYINLRYTHLTLTPVFDMDAGAFSRYDPATNTLYLGDGEQALFHLTLDEENAELEDIRVFWQSVNGALPDNKELANGGFITLAQEPANPDSSTSLWRISHTHDYISASPFYLISKDLYYSVYAERTAYIEVFDPPTEENPQGGYHEEAIITVTENTSYEASNREGITGWFVEVD